MQLWDLIIYAPILSPSLSLFYFVSTDDIVAVVVAAVAGDSKLRISPCENCAKCRQNEQRTGLHNGDDCLNFAGASLTFFACNFLAIFLLLLLLFFII